MKHTAEINCAHCNALIIRDIEVKTTDGGWKGGAVAHCVYCRNDSAIYYRAAIFTKAEKVIKEEGRRIMELYIVIERTSSLNPFIADSIEAVITGLEDHNGGTMVGKVAVPGRPIYIQWKDNTDSEIEFDIYPAIGILNKAGELSIPRWIAEQLI